MHSLQPHHKAPSKVTHVAMSSSSTRIMVCYQLVQEKRQVRMIRLDYCLYFLVIRN